MQALPDTLQVAVVATETSSFDIINLIVISITALIVAYYTFETRCLRRAQDKLLEVERGRVDAERERYMRTLDVKLEEGDVEVIEQETATEHGPGLTRAVITFNYEGPHVEDVEVECSDEEIGAVIIPEDARKRPLRSGSELKIMFTRESYKPMSLDQNRPSFWLFYTNSEGVRRGREYRWDETKLGQVANLVGS
jgi:hypothetical protein